MAISHRKCRVAAFERQAGDVRRPRRVLIIGATGVLRPAALSLAAKGWAVVAVARNQARLEQLAALNHHLILPVILDVHDRPAVERALASEPLRHRVDDALVYVAGPDDEQENAAVDQLSSAVTGTTVRILTSHWAPAGPPDLSTGRWPRRAGRLHLLLGVNTLEQGRWHTPEEISAAAVRSLTDGSDRLLGRLPAK